MTLDDAFRRDADLIGLAGSRTKTGREDVELGLGARGRIGEMLDEGCTGFAELGEDDGVPDDDEVGDAFTDQVCRREHTCVAPRELLDELAELAGDPRGIMQGRPQALRDELLADEHASLLGRPGREDRPTEVEPIVIELGHRACELVIGQGDEQIA